MFDLGKPPRAFRVTLKDGSMLTFEVAKGTTAVLSISSFDLITQIESSTDGKTFDWVYRRTV